MRSNQHDPNKPSSFGLGDHVTEMEAVIAADYSLVGLEDFQLCLEKIFSSASKMCSSRKGPLGREPINLQGFGWPESAMPR